MLTDLILFRHGKAAAQGFSADGRDVDDFARPLTPRGRAQAAEQARQLAALGLRPNLTLVSSAVRAVQTWREAEPHFQGVPTQITRHLYLAPAPTYLDAAEQSGKARVIIIAHNSGLHDLANWLMSDPKDHSPQRTHLHNHFPTSAIAWFTADGSQPSGYRLLHYLAPAAYRGEG